MAKKSQETIHYTRDYRKGVFACTWGPFNGQAAGPPEQEGFCVQGSIEAKLGVYFHPSQELPCLEGKRRPMEVHHVRRELQNSRATGSTIATFLDQLANKNGLLSNVHGIYLAGCFLKGSK